MSTTRNAIWLTACRLAGDVLNLLLFVFISRQFGPEGAGAYSYGFAVATFAFVIACLGIEEYGLRQYSRLELTARGSFLSDLLGAQLYMVAIAVLGLALYLALTGPSQQTVLMVCALGFYQITAAVVPTLFIPAMAQQQMANPALAELITRVIAFATTGLLIGIGRTSLAVAVVGFPLAAVIWLGLALHSVRRFQPVLQLTASWAEVSRVVNTLWSFALLEIFAQLFARIGVISLSLSAGNAAAGIYATGLRLIEVGLMPLSFFGLASYPRLSRLFATDPSAFRRSAADLLWLVMCGGLTLAWGLYFVAPALLVPVLGPRFAGAEPVVRSMAMLALLQAVEVALGRIMLCADRQAANAGFIACGAVLGLILNVILVPILGVNGAILGCAAAYMTVVTLCVGALKGPLDGGMVARMMLSLLALVGAGSGITALLWRANFALWVQAIFCAAVLLLAGGSILRLRSYSWRRTRHG